MQENNNKINHMAFFMTLIFDTFLVFYSCSLLIYIILTYLGVVDRYFG